MLMDALIAETSAPLECHRSDTAGPRSTPSRRERAAALVALAVVAGATVATSQLTKSAQIGFKAPFFIMCLHLSFLAPLWLLASLLPYLGLNQDQEQRFAFADVLVLLPLQVASSYFYVSALSFAPAGVVQVLFGTAPAVVAVLSRFLLGELLALHRTAAVLLAVAGGISLGYGSATGSSSQSVGSFAVGAILAIAAVCAAAFYKVLFKKRLGEPNVQIVLKLLGSMGVTTVVFGMPIAVLLSALGIEDKWWNATAADVQWDLVFASAACDAVYYIATSFALALSSPVFVAIGILIGGPLSMIIDVRIRGASESLSQILGTVLIMISFATLIFHPCGRRVA